MAMPGFIAGVASEPFSTRDLTPVRTSVMGRPSGIPPYATGRGAAGRTPGPRCATTTTYSSSTSRIYAKLSSSIASTWNPPRRSARDSFRSAIRVRQNSNNSPSHWSFSHGMHRRAAISESPSKPISSPYNREGVPTYVRRSPIASRMSAGSLCTIEAMRGVS